MRYQPKPVGRFSVFGYAYRIEPHDVTLSRNTWLALPGAVLAAGGGYLALSVTLMPLVMICVLVAMSGLLIALAGLRPPRRVKATAKGLRWGGTWIPAKQIISVDGLIRDIRVKGTLVQYAALVVKCDGVPDRELRLQNASVPNLRVNAIASAMSTLFGRPKAATDSAAE
ncbi:MAG: hypothetical protein JWO36_5662 [Myxococcales bacterium]|nr:hypothetical protein [Myxococcales bacterium]